ncbi:MAG: hypothetical protein PHO05_07845 [bacterium]|nr:hypothetical protein [bacterium]
MGEKTMAVTGTELDRVLVTCPECGLGLYVDLNKSVAKQLREGCCPCGASLRDMRELVLAYHTALSLIRDRGLEISFAVKGGD